jgi:hypothetical protein
MTHKLDYLLSCVPPSLIQTQAARYDRAVIDTFSIKVDITMQLSNPAIEASTVVQQIRSPLSDGGFGIASAESLSPRAFISSIASTVQSPVSLSCIE